MCEVTCQQYRKHCQQTSIITSQPTIARSKQKNTQQTDVEACIMQARNQASEICDVTHQYLTSERRVTASSAPERRRHCSSLQALNCDVTIRGARQTDRRTDSQAPSVHDDTLCHAPTALSFKVLADDQFLLRRHQIREQHKTRDAVTVYSNHTSQCHMCSRHTSQRHVFNNTSDISAIVVSSRKSIDTKNIKVHCE